MKKLITYYNFIIVSFVVVAGFISANSLLQFAIAILFFPLFVYFFCRVMPRKVRSAQIPNRDVVFEDEKESVEEAKMTVLKKEGIDINRRMFLKLAGSAGVALFIFAIFNKKTESAFFGNLSGANSSAVSIKDSQGNKIDPSEKQPTDGYKINELDDSDTTYYGFVRKDGAWFIMREDPAGSFRYIKGPANFSASWTNRTGLSYDYFDNVF